MSVTETVFAQWGADMSCLPAEVKSRPGSACVREAETYLMRNDFSASLACCAEAAKSIPLRRDKSAQMKLKLRVAVVTAQCLGEMGDPNAANVLPALLGGLPAPGTHSFLLHVKILAHVGRLHEASHLCEEHLSNAFSDETKWMTATPSILRLYTESLLSPRAAASYVADHKGLLLTHMGLKDTAELEERVKARHTKLPSLLGSSQASHASTSSEAGPSAPHHHVQPGVRNSPAVWDAIVSFVKLSLNRVSSRGALMSVLAVVVLLLTIMLRGRVAAAGRVKLVL